MLPELDGRAVIRAVRRDDEAAHTPILVLSARSSTIDRIAGLEDGADDYLPKPFSPAELVLRVKSILRRGDGPTDRATAASGSAGRPGHPPWRPDDRPFPARGPARRRVDRPDPRRVPAAVRDPRCRRRVLSRDQLLDAVYGQDAADVLDRTIDVHIRRLRDKLDDDPDAPRYVQTVRGVGYRAARTPRPA